MATTDATERIRAAIERFARAVPDLVIARPPPPKRVAFLIQEAGPLAPGLDAYFAVCDGVRWVKRFPGPLASLAQMLDIDAPGYFVLGDDGDGNYDLVAASGVGAGAVVSWDHELQKTERLLASSVASYIELWTLSQAARATGAPDPTKGKWPKNAAFMKKHDPGYAELQGSAAFKKQLRPVEIEYVDYEGRIKSRTGINPFTGQPMTSEAPPRKRRKR